jgi:hypothetical protein
MRDKHEFFFNQSNKKMKKMNELTENYNNQANKLHDALLIIRELKVEQRKRNVINSDTFLLITEREVFIVTFKKIFNSSVFTDDKNSFIND